MTANFPDPQFFTVFSLSRCGSSALFRALKAHKQIRCSYEPQFEPAKWDSGAVLGMIAEIRAEYSGMKHVWDPSGFPFVSSHDSFLPALENNYHRVLKLNKVVLSAADRVVFLTRRNRLDRILSDLLGQQTNVWTPAHPHFPSANLETVIQEASHYKSEVLKRDVQPLDLKVIEWYLEHEPHMDEEFRRIVPREKCLYLHFEDLFNPKLDTQSRRNNYVRIMEFLGFPSGSCFWDEQEVDALFDPRAKLNSRVTFDLIPNIEEIRDRFS